MTGAAVLIAGEVPAITAIFAGWLGWTWKRRVAADDEWREEVRKALGEMRDHVIRAGMVEREIRADIRELKRRRA